MKVGSNHKCKDTGSSISTIDQNNWKI